MTDGQELGETAHRQLRFESIEDCVAEVNRIRDAAARETLRTSGNWTPGQNLSHVAAWINYAYDGFPITGPPWLVRWILRWRLPSMLRQEMPRGVRIPGVDAGTVGMEDMDAEEACGRLLDALARLESDEEASFDSPAFGKMSDEDRVRLNLRHAELHLGFLVY